MTAPVGPARPFALLEGLAAAARAAGEQIMVWYGRADVQERAKADCSPVTAADLAAHEALAAALPGLSALPVISEETAGDEVATLREMAAAARYWLVDPLDGTRDFLAQTGDFTVNVALIEGGDAVVGCVLVPVTGACYVAARGGGAFLQELPGGPWRPVRCRRPPARPVCLVSRSHQAGEATALAALAAQPVIRAVGSSLKYVVIAAGEADLALRTTPTSLWDTAAAQCVLEEAGGALLTFAGLPLRYNTGKLENPPFLALGDPAFPWRALLGELGLAPQLTSLPRHH